MIMKIISERQDKQADLSGDMMAARPRRAWLRQIWLVPVVYVFATCFTDAHFMADTGGYVVSILAYEGVQEYVEENPVVRDYRSENPFWEFGHLLWRPLGLVVFNIFAPLYRSVADAEPGAIMVFLLMTINWVAGLLSAFLMYALTKRITGKAWVASFTTLAFIFSHGFLNFVQTGSSYIAGLSLILLGLYFLVAFERDADRHWRAALPAGVSLAGGVCMWLPYVWAVPAILMAPLLLFGADRQGWRVAFRATLVFALATGLAYASVMAHLGISSKEDLQAWISASSHGVQTSGATRVVFGLPRSLTYMGNDGLLFKRYLLNDPFNPVSAVDFIRGSLFKLCLFYLLAALMVVALPFSPKGRRILALLMLNAVPLLAFALLFDGGAIERYLPLYPLMFLALGWAVGQVGRVPVLKVVSAAFVITMIIANASALQSGVLERKQAQVAARIESLMPVLKERSVVITTHLQDELVNFQASYPFHPANRHGNYSVYSAVVVGTSQVEKWREGFAARAVEVWSLGGDVWITKRVFSPRPQPEWNWVEGDDRRVSWVDINSFFSQLEVGETTGIEDGFMLLLPSQRNTELLSRLTSGANYSAQGQSHKLP
jgi:hypothetical protein